MIKKPDIRIINYLMHHKKADIREIFSIMFKHSRKIRILIPVELFFLFVDGFVYSRIPVLLKYIIDGLEKGYDSFLQHDLNWAIFYSIILSFGWCISAMIQHYLKEKNSTTIMVGVQLSLYDHIQNLSMEFYQSTYVGEITNRLTNDIYRSIKEIYYSFTHLIWIAGLIIPSLITMAFLDIGFFGVFSAFLVIFSIVITIILPIVRKKHRLAMDQMGTINAKITESVYSMMLIKSFAREKDFADKIQKESASFLDKIMKAVRIRVLGTDTISMMVGILAPTSLLWIGALLRIKVSTLMAFFTYWFTTGGQIRSILEMLQRITGAFASFDRIYDFFQYSPMVQDLPDAEKLTIKNGKIEIDKVNFGYPAAGVSNYLPVADRAQVSYVLSNFSLTIPEKTKTAIVGRSGCGKTTILNLILRFFDPNSGEIRIDGKDIRTLDQKHLRSQIGLVMQETLLLNGTVRENMKFVSSDADDKQIIQALKQAQIWDYFKSNGDGLDSVIGERGVRLSGGQKQRISIARIFLKDPAIVLLDEATSSMDSETEQSIMESMERMLSGRTSIIISHRLSTVQNCDFIIVMDSGRIIDKGTHEQLFNRCDLYHNLCTRQDLT